MVTWLMRMWLSALKLVYPRTPVRFGHCELRHCNTLQRTAQHTHTPAGFGCHGRRQATHYTPLHHAATHYNTLKHTTPHYNTLAHTATHHATHCTKHTHTSRIRAPRMQTLGSLGVPHLHKSVRPYAHKSVMLHVCSRHVTHMNILGPTKFTNTRPSVEMYLHIENDQKVVCEWVMAHI